MRRARGQALVEYLVSTLVLLGVLFVPVIPSPHRDGFVSLFFLFVNAFDVYLNSFHYVISLPIP